jgi:hypothetical protein
MYKSQLIIQRIEPVAKLGQFCNRLLKKNLFFEIVVTLALYKYHIKSLLPARM